MARSGSKTGTALITGASSGLGAEFARLFAADGHNVVLVARRKEQLDQLAAELSAKGVRADVLPADLAKRESADDLLRAVTELGLEIDYLVNNAGFGSNGAFTELDRQRELRMIDVNIAAVVNLTHLFLPQMIERGFGRVMNVASTAGFQPGPFMSTYYASKAFVIAFSEGLRHELRKTGVTVTCHCPGATLTEFADVSGNIDSWLFKLQAAPADKVARHGYRALHRGKRLAVQGFVNWLGTVLVQLSPRGAVPPVSGWLNSRA